jgi:hydroxymethylglutaryl-CoA synthase
MESGVGLFKHVSQAVTEYFKKYGYKPQDFDFVVFQQPVGVVPVALCLRLGFSMEQVIPGLIAYEIGDVGSASALISLALTLDQARPGQKILLASHGFGTGADVTVLKVTENISRYKRTGLDVDGQIKRKDFVDYATAMKYEGKYMKVSHALSAWL